MVNIDSSTVFLIVVAALANYRLAMLLTLEDGPFDVFFELRRKMGAYRRREDGQPSPTHIGNLLSCPYCMGVWLALVLSLLLFPFSAVSFLYWFSIAGCQAFLQSVTGDM